MARRRHRSRAVNPAYPTSAAISGAVGYGTWSAGWLCNETSGTLAAAFGSLSLTAKGSADK